MKLLGDMIRQLARSGYPVCNWQVAGVFKKKKKGFVRRSVTLNRIDD